MTKALALAGLLAVPAAATGVLTPVDAAYGKLEIEEHHVRVVIHNGFAMTEVDQVFVNPHERDLEARYSFPVPERAAMSELSLWIDGKELRGEVLSKARAREAYEEEKRAGGSTALNEKSGYKDFTVSVSPVRARQKTRVRLVYYQPLRLDHGIGRYVYPLEEGGTDETRATAFFLNDVVTGEASLDIDLTLKTAYPVAEVLVPSHPDAKVEKLADGSFRARLHRPGPVRLDSDFVFNYRLAQDRPAGVELIPYKPDADGEGTFMAVITPGADLKPLTGGADWTFVLDVSGSMQDKLASLVEGVQKALGRMSEADRFRIALFNQQGRWLIREFTPANRENAANAARLVGGLKADGGTDLHAGLAMGLDALDADRVNGLILVTDGVMNAGITDPKQVLALLRAHDIRVFTFVMGNSANEPLLKDLADATNGFAMSVSNSEAIVGQLLAAKSKLSHESLRAVRVAIDGPKVAQVTPAAPRTLYRGDQLVLFGKYRGEGPGKLVFEALASGGPQKVEIPLAFPKRDARNPELGRLWAMARIEELEQDKRLGADAKEVEDVIRDIAVRHSLVTDYTSMIVMGEGRFAERGIARRNAARVEAERAAQVARSAAQPVSYGAPAPASSGWRAPSLGGGGGCVGPVFGLFSGLLGVLGARRRRKR